MRVPLSWLREFTDCELSADDLAARLTVSGLEIDAIDRVGVYSHEVIVGEITSCRQHDKADKLHIVEVDIGTGEPAIAVTGAPNVTPESVGSKVATAVPGAILIDVKAEFFQVFSVVGRAVMGTDSNAVLCSEKELGLSDDHSGVLFLDDGKPGEVVLSQREPGPDAAADIVLEVAILPNEGRCLSIVGMAREIAALTRSTFRVQLDATHVESSNKAFPITIADPELCPRYTGFVLENLEVRPSPDWMQRRLVLTGHKPINCLVDVTNYIMTELGQPMHAFDLDKLPAKEITVRRAKNGETMHTLDQKLPENDDDADAPPREFDESMLLITSNDEPVAVAGVIGGLNSQIYPDTKNVLLESANFDAIAVRKASSVLKINTDSSYRFSRDVDPHLTTVALQRAVKLLEESAGAKPTGELTDLFPRPPELQNLTVTAAEISRYLGVEVSREDVESSLTRLGFDVTSVDDSEEIQVEIPAFRTDVSIPADLAEEVIRVLGFDRLEPRRLHQELPQQRKNVSWDTRQEIRNFLAGAELQDVITYSMTSLEVEAKLFAADDAPDWQHTELLNPVSQERSVMRRTLLAGLLETVERNQRHRDSIALFEIGHVWHPEKGDGQLPAEPFHLSGVMTGPLNDSTWAQTESPNAGFFDLKGIVEGLLQKLHIENVEFRRFRDAPYHPGVAAELVLGGKTVGQIGAVHPEVLRAFGIDREQVVAFEFDLEPIIESVSRQYKFESYSRFPPVVQDLNLVVDESISSQDVETAIVDAAGDLLNSIRLLNLYRGEQLGAGKKSLSFRMAFCAADRSLQEEEVNDLRDEILPKLKDKTGAEIR